MAASPNWAARATAYPLKASLTALGYRKKNGLQRKRHNPFFNCTGLPPVERDTEGESSLLGYIISSF